MQLKEKMYTRALLICLNDLSKPLTEPDNPLNENEVLCLIDFKILKPNTTSLSKCFPDLEIMISGILAIDKIVEGEPITLSSQEREYVEGNISEHDIEPLLFALLEEELKGVMYD